MLMERWHACSLERWHVCLLIQEWLKCLLVVERWHACCGMLARGAVAFLLAHSGEVVCSLAHSAVACLLAHSVVLCLLAHSENEVGWG